MTGDAPVRQRFAVPRTLGGRMRAPALGLLIALTGVLAACSAKPDDAARRPAVYVLAGTQGQPSALLTLSADGGKTLSRTALRQAGASVMALGDDGRLWVGGRSVSGLPLTSITVLDPALGTQTRVTTPANPGAGLALAGGKLYVAASQNGFGGAVAEIDPATLATRTLEIPAPTGKSYILTALAAAGDKVVVAGMTQGPDPAKRYAAVTVLDARTLTIAWRSEVLANADIWQILPYQGGFVLLNAASAEDPRAPAMGGWLLNAEQRLSALPIEPAAVWGAVAGDVLYSYHNAAWNALSGSRARAVSTYNFTTGQRRTTALPDGMDARDLLLAGDRLLLSVRSNGDEQPSGVYALKLNAGQLNDRAPAPVLVAQVDGPGKLLWRPAPAAAPAR